MCIFISLNPFMIMCLVQENENENKIENTAWERGIKIVIRVGFDFILIIFLFLFVF